MVQRLLAYRVQPPRDYHAGISENIPIEDSLHNLSLPGLYGNTVAFYHITVHIPQSDQFAPFHLFPNSPFAVFGNGSALLLRKRREDGEHQLAIPGIAVDVLPFEKYIYTLSLQFPQYVQRIQRIA
ncbi:hypothetical protein SDC9_101064 [bioreactor metagenome]|uniref:Uncharacterized protein n=1 Tax=bioreactor metagenome TaxID=1076179 RepID=A0A645AMZ0_9ZZZZ